MIKKINSKGQGMSTSTIVLLILGLVILVVLILGFTLGWNQIVPWIKSDNLNTLKSSCEIACTTGSEYQFCSVMKTVKDGVNDNFEETCYNLATNETYVNRGYGIATCPSIDCSAE